MYKEIHIHDITWPCHKITYDTIAMIKKQCKGHLQFYRMFVTVSMMIVRDVSRDIWYLMIFKIVFNHHLSWCQRFMIQASVCLWWYFFHFSLCFCLKAWRINGKAGEKCSNYRSYDLTHQRDWKSLNFLKIEMVCCLKSNSLKSKKQLHSFPSFFAAGLWWTRFSWSRNGHETPAPSHFKTRMAYLGGDVCCRTSLMSSMPSVVSCSGSLDSKYF